MHHVTAVFLWKLKMYFKTMIPQQKSRPIEVTIVRNMYKLHHILFLAFIFIILMMQTLLYLYNYIITNNVIKTEKIKFTLEQAMRARRGSRGITLYSYFNLGAGWGWVFNATLRPFFFRGEDSRYPLHGRLAGP
jgi:hypothetical protein